MSGFDGAYFVGKDAGPGYKVVKYGDTRSDSENSSNYRSGSDPKFVHGNSNNSSVGKLFEKQIMGDLVERGMAKQIGKSESYIVKDSTFKSLEKNWKQNTQGGFISNDNIDSIMNQQINSGYGRSVHGKAKGKKF